jgi:RNA polymerase sigma factor (sigma-70 family)
VRRAIVARQAPARFECPLRSACFAGARPFASFRAANRAAARYHACACPATRERHAARLYERHLPLVRKTLGRFCATSKCYPGGCQIEDLVGESYLAFRQALDRYDPAYGVDFVGYVSQRLHWTLEHRARNQQDRALRLDAPELEATDGEEERALNRVWAADVLARFDAADAELLARDAAGHTDRELAAAAGVSPAAVRKRLERLRRRAREGRNKSASGARTASVG